MYGQGPIYLHEALLHNLFRFRLKEQNSGIWNKVSEMLMPLAGQQSSFPIENVLTNLKSSFFQLLEEDDKGNNPDQMIGNGNRGKRTIDDTGSDVISNSTAEYSSPGKDMIEQSLIASGLILINVSLSKKARLFYM